MPQLKQLARQIFHETLAAIDIAGTMQRKLQRKGAVLMCGEISQINPHFTTHQRKGAVLMCGEMRIDLRNFEKLRVVAIGKAAHAMVEGLTQVLAPFVRMEGVVSAPTAARKPL